MKCSSSFRRSTDRLRRFAEARRAAGAAVILPKNPRNLAGKAPVKLSKRFFRFSSSRISGLRSAAPWGPPSGRTRAPAGGVLSPRREAGRGRVRRLRAALCSVNSRAGRGRSLFESSHPLESGQKKRGAPLREHLCMMIIRQERCAFQADKPCHSLPFRVIPCQLFRRAHGRTCCTGRGSVPPG